MNTLSKKKWQSWLAIGQCTLAVAGITIFGLFVASAPYSTDPRALSPVGVLVVLAALLLGTRWALRFIRHTRRTIWGLVAIAVLVSSFFVAAPAGAAPLPPVTFRQVASATAPTLVNQWAWRATLDIHPSQGIQGVTPLFFRPLVPWMPVTLFVTPHSPSNTLRPIAVATMHQVLPLTGSPAIWNSLPPQSIRVNNFVVLVGVPAVREAAPTFFNPALLQANCTTCWNQFQLEVNPAYVDKMAWEGMKLVGMALPVPQTGGILKFSDLFAAAEIANAFVSNPSGKGLELAQAKLAGWSVGKISGLGMNAYTKADNPMQFAIPYIAKVSGKVTESMLAPQTAPNPDWSWRTMRWSGGRISSGNAQLMWVSRQSDTYRGTFLNQGWTSTRTTRVVQTTIPIPELPALTIPKSPAHQPMTKPPSMYTAPRIPQLPVYDPPTIPQMPIYDPALTIPKLPTYQSMTIPQPSMYTAPRIPQLPVYNPPTIPQMPIYNPSTQP